MGLVSDLGPTDRWLFHYTTASTALEKILPSMRIRLGSLESTNDPWESKTINLGLGKCAPEHMHATLDRINQLASAVRVACFSTDDVAHPPDARAVLGASSRFGWARDRMWAQYADGHRGVCLMFDRDRLVASVRASIGHRGELLADSVKYRDDLITPVPNFETSTGIGPEAYARAFRPEYVRARCFQKRLDWQQEREFRIAVLGDDGSNSPIYADVGDSLRGIVVGDRFPDTRRIDVERFCESREPRLCPHQISFQGGATLMTYDSERILGSFSVTVDGQQRTLRVTRVPTPK